MNFMFWLPGVELRKIISLNFLQEYDKQNSWTACQSSQVVSWLKTKPGLAGNQIPFGGTRFGFTTVGVYNTSIIDTYTSKTKSGSSEGKLSKNFHGVGIGPLKSKLD